MVVSILFVLIYQIWRYGKSKQGRKHSYNLLQTQTVYSETPAGSDVCKRNEISWGVELAVDAISMAHHSGYYCKHPLLHPHTCQYYYALLYMLY